MNQLIKIPRTSKENPSKYKKIKEIFEIEPESLNTSNNKIKIQYNKNVFFNPTTKKNDYLNESKEDKNNMPQQEELTKIINNVINSTITNNNAEKNQSIKVNLNINNNFFNSNYNYVMNKEKLNNGVNNIVNQSNETNNDGGTGINNFMSKINYNKNLEKVFTQSILNTENDLTNNSAISPLNSSTNTRSSITNNQLRPSTNFPRNSVSYVATDSSQSRSLQAPYTSFFIPCINCNNLIHMDEIENHSNVCIRVKEEVIVAEGSNFTVHNIDFKLKKLQEHINYIKNADCNNAEFLKEIHYISLLLQYIVDTVNVSKIDHRSIAELKKISINIDVFFITNNII